MDNVSHPHQGEHVTLLALLSLALVGLALLQLWQLASQPYVLDIIGRTLRIDAVVLSQGLPIYSQPGLAMPYTPGFVLLNALVIKFYGFDYLSWNVVWASSGLIFLIGYSGYFWLTDKVFTPYVAAGLLACLFPFVWSRGDVYANLLVGLGMLLLASGSSWKVLVALSLMGLALFFKQTMLPVIFAIVLLTSVGSPLRGDALKRCAILMTGVAFFFGLLSVTYIVFWHEDISSIIATLTVGKRHSIRLEKIVFYGLIYFLAIAAPCFYILRNARWAVDRLLVLSVFGVPYILFSAKDGGGWHHYLALLLPWLWMLAAIRKDPRTLKQPFIDRFLWSFGLLLMILAYSWFPFRPSVANVADSAAFAELSKILYKMPAVPDDQALFLDSADGFAFPESAYLAGYRARYSRGAIEEWSGAEGRLPVNLINDVDARRLTRVFVRKGEALGATAYGVPYEPLYKALKKSYVLCTDTVFAYWTVLCPVGNPKVEESRSS